MKIKREEPDDDCIPFENITTSGVFYLDEDIDQVSKLDLQPKILSVKLSTIEGPANQEDELELDNANGEININDTYGLAMILETGQVHKVENSILCVKVDGEFVVST